MRPFEYATPESVEEVLELLAKHGEDARIIAGGQSLLILMRQRLVQPAVLVSLARIEALRRIESSADGGIRLGAMVSYREASASDSVRHVTALLARAAGSVGSMHIRALGTLGGAMCHADPAGDVLVAMMALDGAVEAALPDSTRTFPAAEFPAGLFATHLPANAVLTHLHVPAQPAGAVFGYERFLLREGEYPMTQTAVRLEVGDGIVRGARVAVGGEGDRPRRLGALEAWLSGQSLQSVVPEQFATRVREAVRPTPDIRGSAWWKTEVIAATARRALVAAIEQIAPG